MTEPANSEMEELRNFKRWPLWKKIGGVLLAIGALFMVIGTASEYFLGSPEARAYKAQMEPLAEQLVTAQKLGDKPTVLALADPTVKIVSDFNALDDAQKEKIKNSPLRNCILAAVHLSSDPIEILNTGIWASQSKYEAALNACK